MNKILKLIYKICSKSQFKISLFIKSIFNIEKNTLFFIKIVKIIITFINNLLCELLIKFRQNIF